jgi:vancomycin aglycone glucosyltransferase
MKFVVAGYGSRGDVEPCIALARELLRRGHDVGMAVTIPPDMRGFVESAGLTEIPYGRHWEALLRDEDFIRMMQNPVKAMSQAADYVVQTWEDKSATLKSVANGADLLLAGIAEQRLAANIAEYYGIPLAWPQPHRMCISRPVPTPAKASWPPMRNFSAKPARPPGFRRPTPGS